MKHMNILCLILAMLLCAGCGAPTIKGTVEPTARPANSNDCADAGRNA